MSWDFLIEEVYMLALDHDKDFNGGLYLIDKESYKNVLQYIEIIHPKSIDMFIDCAYLNMTTEIPYEKLPTFEKMDVAGEQVLK